MDRLWLSHNLDLRMTPYRVLGTDCEQGFVEFVGNTATLAKMQYIDGLTKTFADDTVEKFMTKETKKYVAKLMGGGLLDNGEPNDKIEDRAKFE